MSLLYMPYSLSSSQLTCASKRWIHHKLHQSKFNIASPVFSHSISIGGWTSKGCQTRVYLWVPSKGCQRRVICEYPLTTETRPNQNYWMPKQSKKNQINELHQRKRKHDKISELSSSRNIIQIHMIWIFSRSIYLYICLFCPRKTYWL